ncbi:conserved hypothetical protein [Ricinus communis]|uniref:Uncharacterized protein n=1 Tax=Ricinus communis TaxID=3988 RepID=B9TC58_RICCO|nr:conserved hypothetical protein [Ricinus communis]
MRQHKDQTPPPIQPSQTKNPKNHTTRDCSSNGAGAPKKNPCMTVHPSPRSASACASVCTPSATHVNSSDRHNSRMLLTISRAAGSLSIRSRNPRSIFTLSNGSR